MSVTISPITMPKLGLSMTEGTVAAWHVDPGSEVSAGDVIADIETSKITNELEVHVGGVFRRSVVEVGVEVSVGALIGVIADPEISDDEIDEFIDGYAADGDRGRENTVAAEQSPDFSSPATAAESPQAVGQDDGRMPEGLLGDYDAASVFATHHAHKLARRLRIDLAKIAGTGRRGRISRRDVEQAISARGGDLAETGWRRKSGASPARHDGRRSVKTTPAARRMAKEYDIDLAEVPATGSRGRVSKGDILKFLERTDSSVATTAAARPESEHEPAREEVLGSTRRTIARRLTESKRNAPHYRLTTDVCIDKVLDLRRDIEDGDPESRVSVNDILVCAAAQALIRHGDVNIQFDGEKISRFPHADIAVAVAAETGLVTPIVRAADKKGLRSLASELRELVDRARKGRLLPDDLAGGTFTLSNLGMYGVKSFDAIINPPQAAIMAVGSAGRRLYVGEDDNPNVGTFITVTLSCDHRVIDGASGAAFLLTFTEMLERPGRLLL